MRPALVAIAAAALLAVALGSSAAAATKAPPRGAEARIEILSPSEGKRVMSRTLSVRLAVSTRAGFQASVDGRDVSRRFKRRGGVLVAKLRRGDDFRYGENYLMVGTGRAAARRTKTLTFVARRHARPLLDVSASHTRSARTPLRVRLRVDRPVSRVALTLNKRRVPLEPPAGRRSWVVALGADDGLRFGRNSLTAKAERSGSGHFDRERLRFHLDRSAPLVGAGPDRVTRRGRAVVLDGRATRAAGRRGLVYRWELIEKPRGSRARIANSTAKVARLLPDVSGTYRARLVAAPASDATRAAERRPGASASEAASEPTCLQHADPDASTGAAADPLEAPVCVTPVGDASTPPLPPESRAAAAADIVKIHTLPTSSPMGWPIQTIMADGSVQVGPQNFAKKAGWARLIVLNEEKLEPESGPWGSGDQVFSLAEAKELAEDVEKTTNRQIVVISGMGQPQSQVTKAAEEALAKAVTTLGAQAPPSEARAEMIRSGSWSAVGAKKEPGRTFTNLYGLTQQTPVEASGETLPGSLNGYLQKVLVEAFGFVSPEFVPIDTRAEGSSNTVSVFKVGEETITSRPIGNGSLGLHVAVFATDAAGGLPKAVASGTYVIDNPYSQTNMAGVREAAEALQGWSESPHDYLIVMQTFGEEAVGPNTAPWASPNWVNDALLHPTSHGLFEWRGQPYVSVKNESELEEKLDRFWNPGYPTVAGQVGNLTGSVGHDVVANLGAGNPNVEVTRLTMVAGNHPQNPTLNYVRGFPGPAQGRLVGTLVRNSEAGWSVQTGAPSPAFSPGELWKTVYEETEPWPNSEGRENAEAMRDIARRLFGLGAINVREEYIQRRSAPWLTRANELRAMRYEPTNAYTGSTFRELQKDLVAEMEDVAAVKESLGEWQKIFTDSSFKGYVRVGELGSRIAELAVKDAREREKQEGEVNPEAIMSEVLYTAADLVGFPEAYEEIKLAEMIGVVAGGFGLAEAASPEPPEAAEGDNSAMIRARAGQLGKALVEHFEETTEALGHMENIILSDAGKLKAAGVDAGTTWAFSEEAEKKIRHSLSITTSQELYEGLLPVAYDQWVVAPWFTNTNPQGPQPPGKGYACLQYTPAWESEETKHPFKDEPSGALSTAIYRPWNAPGSTTSPAVPYSVPYTLRGLKSVNNELKVSKKEYGENRYAVTVTHDGSSPPGSLMNPIFEAVNPGERHPDFPVALGMSKVEFFAGFGGGPPDWHRLICAQE